MSYTEITLLPLRYDEEEAKINLYRALDEERDFLIEWEQSIRERKNKTTKNKINYGRVKSKIKR